MLRLMRMCVWNSMPVWISYRSFWQKWIFISGIKYHVNTTRNEMPTYVHQNVGSLGNATEMKLHVNRACFQAGLKSQTGMSWFRLSFERTLIIVSYFIFGSSQQRFSIKNVVLKNSQNSKGNAWVRVSFLINLQTWCL